MIDTLSNWPHDESLALLKTYAYIKFNIISSNEHNFLIIYAMGLTFTAPLHPGLANALRASPPVHVRDPHNLPTFSANGEPTTPILYLPPLLSSLPHVLKPPKIDPKLAPITTDTRLPDIDPASLSLHKALHYFRPLSNAYADLPYADGFNWRELELPEEEEREWYIVAFRSKRRDGSDGGRKDSIVSFIQE